MQRLLRKFETAKRYVPGPIVQRAARTTRTGVIHYGSTAAAMDEALALLRDRGIDVDVLRVRAFPFSSDIVDFIAGHDRVFVVEQNRDAQLRTLVIAENAIDPQKLVPVLHYDGTPITARFIAKSIGALMPDLLDAPKELLS